MKFLLRLAVIMLDIIGLITAIGFYLIFGHGIFSLIIFVCLLVASVVFTVAYKILYEVYRICCTFIVALRQDDLNNEENNDE